jgi:hypothetical protein
MLKDYVSFIFMGPRSKTNHSLEGWKPFTKWQGACHIPENENPDKLQLACREEVAVSGILYGSHYDVNR